jgi:hypothetical protein
VFCMDVAKVDQNIAYYVAMTIHVCCKRMFQMFYLVFFSDVCCKCVYLDVANVSYICCKCFIWILHMFCNGFASVFRVFFASVLDTCFKCFICLQMYVANVSSECFKSRLNIAHVIMVPVDGGQRPAVGLRLLPHVTRLALLSLLAPPFPSLHLAAAVRARPRRGVQWRWSRIGCRAEA